MPFSPTRLVVRPTTLMLHTEPALTVASVPFLIGATIVLTPVENPSAYGLVETDADQNIKAFLEKPSADQITCDTINAGISYQVRPSLQLTLDVANLTNEPQAFYRGIRAQMQNTILNGSTLTFGLNGRF